MNRICVKGRQLIKAEDDGTINIDRNLFLIADEINITADVDGKVCVSIKTRGYNPNDKTQADLDEEEDNG